MTDYIEPTLDEALAQRDEAMGRAERGTDEAWRAEADHAVNTLARGFTTFTADDVWFELARRQVEPPREPRALGPVLRRAISDNRIVWTGVWEQSKRRHGSPVPAYRGSTWMRRGETR